MLHSLIVPTKFINDPEIGGRSDFILALSHLINDKCNNEYTKEIMKSGKPIVLDNGTFENGVPEESESLLKKAKSVGAKIVFAPDYLYDSQKNLSAFDKFLDIKQKLGVDIQVGFVVQADTIEEYLKEYRWANQCDDIDLIGISILTIPHCRSKETGTKDITTNRICALRDIEYEISPSKDAHMLGLGGSLRDLQIAKNYDWIVSNDSSSAFMTGFYGKIYDNNNVPGGKVEEKLNFELDLMGEGQMNCIKQNIDSIYKLLY